MNQLSVLVAESLVNLEDIVQHDFASQRTSADQLEHAVRETLLAADPRFCGPVGVRAPGDILYQGDVLCHINIKTTDASKDFHMPNLISADNLWKIFAKGESFYLLRIIHRSGQIISKDFHDIRDIDWSNLQLGALGSGQIQIKNGLNPIVPNPGSRDEWMTQWKHKMIKFYDNELVKINKRLIKWSSR